MKIEIKEGDGLCGKTVLAVLKSMSLSSRMIKYLKYRDDGIFVGGKRVTVRYVLRVGDVLSLALDDAVSADCLPTDTELSVVFENDDIIVVDKPPFMPTHTSHGHYDDTLANALAGYYSKKGVPFVFRPINRLDRNTSGLVLVAKNKIAAAVLSKAMREHKIKKSYVAVLKGCLTDPVEETDTPWGRLGVIHRSLHRTAASIIVREVCPDDAPDAESAVTYYRILRRNQSYTLVEAFPQTGRTHQLRVHFAFLGCPILGDDIYGEESIHINRHALHARTLTLPLPETPSCQDRSDDTECVTLDAPLPEDMSTLIEKLFPKESYEKDIQA